MVDIDRWLRADRVASPADAALLRELALELLTDIAADAEAPRTWEITAACELATATFHALAGDWSVGEALKLVAKQDAATRTRTTQAVAVSRADAKAAWGRVVQDVVVRTRALRHMADGTKAKRKGGDVVQFRKVG